MDTKTTVPVSLPDNTVSLIFVKDGKIQERFWCIAPDTEFSKENFSDLLDSFVQKLKDRL
jgi:hypothetical protein